MIFASSTLSDIETITKCIVIIVIALWIASWGILAYTMPPWPFRAWRERREHIAPRDIVVRVGRFLSISDTPHDPPPVHPEEITDGK